MKTYTNGSLLNSQDKRLSNGLRTVNQAVWDGFIEQLNGLLFRMGNVTIWMVHEIFRTDPQNVQMAYEILRTVCQNERFMKSTERFVKTFERFLKFPIEIIVHGSFQLFIAISDWNIYSTAQK